MNTLDTIVDAINRHKSISYQYISDKNPSYGERRGDPYVAYVYTDISGHSTTKIDIFQVSGASSKNQLSQVKMSDLANFRDIQILEDEPEFTINPIAEYKPESERYKSVIAKV
jgi:transcriptional regulator of nitric oxide reductase